ncbi:MAG: hypothetical protein Unbinned4614contig1000_6 [Prokaryotic dsDNA virus sp.]|nr:MAG: hypothetical protein Unbinned4614contig1000_6 [Prokaryotic dsDNA virus sp.]|tara:strand:- start:2439 stop:3029 length:591 start_codon:yes stop_codon:yes gene_type:complete
MAFALPMAGSIATIAGGVSSYVEAKRQEDIAQTNADNAAIASEQAKRDKAISVKAIEGQTQDALHLTKLSNELELGKTIATATASGADITGSMFDVIDHEITRGVQKEQSKRMVGLNKIVTTVNQYNTNIHKLDSAHVSYSNQAKAYGAKAFGSLITMPIKTGWIFKQAGGDFSDPFGQFKKGWDNFSFSDWFGGD